MYAKRYASVIEGLKTLLSIKDKNQMELDYKLLSNLTYSILNEHTLKETEKSDKVEEAKSETEIPLDENVFEQLNATLSGIEEKLDQEEEEGDEEKDEEKKEALKTENERQFLLQKLTELFDTLQKMVREKFGFIMSSSLVM